MFEAYAWTPRICLRDPLLASRSGLSTAESSLEGVATKLADVAIIDAAA